MKLLSQMCGFTRIARNHIREMRNQACEIFNAIPERIQIDIERIQSFVKILAQFSRLD